MAHGSSLIKQGENGKGVASRWYPGTLAKRILAIYEVRERITFVEGDGFKPIEEQADNEAAAFFIDPPYTASTKKAGKRLYQHNEIDHDLLFESLAKVKGDFLMTYDNDEAVKALADKFGMVCDTIPMKSRNHANMLELLIGRNLSWLHEKRDKELTLF